MKRPKIVIVMPAYNAAKTLQDTYNDIAPKYRENIILVDDASKDESSVVKLAKKLGITVFSHPNNLGYGGNQKTCYWEAMKLNPDVVVMLHPDYQYDPTKIEELVNPILEGKYDYMFGSRIKNRGSAIAGGMPKIKYYMNRLVCLLQNILLGENFSEYFSGYRAYSRKFLKIIPFQRFSNDFVFDQEMTISAISYGMRIGEVAIPTKYHDKASSIGFVRGTKFILDSFLVIFGLYLHRLKITHDNRFKN